MACALFVGTVNFRGFRISILLNCIYNLYHPSYPLAFAGLVRPFSLEEVKGEKCGGEEESKRDEYRGQILSP
jgi:hypothetical protein